METTLNNVQNLLEHIQSQGYLIGMFLDEQFERVSLSRKDRDGCLYNKTDYITKNELNQFLRGYLFAKENKL